MSDSSKAAEQAYGAVCAHGQLERSCNVCELERDRDSWKAKAEANERDAGRYQWIRSHVTESPSLMFESSNPEKHNDWRLAWMLPRIFCRTAINSHIPFDDAIDAARSAEKEKE